MNRKPSTRKSASPKNLTIEDPGSDNRLTLDKIVQLDPWKDIDKYDAQEPGQIQEILVQFNDMVLKDKRTKRKSAGKSRASISSTKKETGDNNNAAVIEESSARENTRNDEIEQQISPTTVNNPMIIEPDNLPVRNAVTDQDNAEKPVERAEKLDVKEEKISKAAANRLNRRSVREKRASTSSITPTAANNDAQGQSTMRHSNDRQKFKNWIPTSEKSGSLVDVGEIIGADNKRDDKSVGSFEVENKDDDKLEKPREMTISEAVAEKNIIPDDTLTISRQRFRKSASPLAPRNDRSKNSAAIQNFEVPSDEFESSKILGTSNTVLEKSAYGNNSDDLSKMTFEDSGIHSSTMKSRSKSAEPERKTILESNNNKYQSKGARKREEKMARAFEKFGKKFVKYSQNVKPSRGRASDVTEDSESDSDSDESSSSSSTSDSDESSSTSSSSSSYSSSSSHCSCCSSSSGSSSSLSDSDTSSSSCDCSRCLDLNYSEYTLASSSSTHPGSDDSTDSTTE